MNNTRLSVGFDCDQIAKRLQHKRYFSVSFTTALRTDWRLCEQWTSRCRHVSVGTSCVQPYARWPMPESLLLQESSCYTSGHVLTTQWITSIWLVCSLPLGKLHDTGKLLRVPPQSRMPLCSKIQRSNPTCCLRHVRNTACVIVSPILLAILMVNVG